MPFAQCSPLLDSIALEAKMLSGFAEKEVPRAHAQGFLWSHLKQPENFSPSLLEQNLPEQCASNLSPYEIGYAPIDHHECYSLEQKNALLAHIEKHWGLSHVVIPSHAITFYDTFLLGHYSPQIQFEVRCIPAHLTQRYYDLYFTVGLGAYVMAVPVDASEGRPVELERIELMLRLPPFYGDNNFRDVTNHSAQGGWPLLLLRSLALKVLHSHQFATQEYKSQNLPVPYVTYYQSYQSAPYLAPWQDLTGCMLVEAQEFDQLSNLCKLPHCTHNLIRLMGVLPLYAEEMAFKHSIDLQGKSGGRALLRKLTNLGFDPYLASLERPHYLV